MRNFTPPSWLPSGDIGKGRWNLCELIDGRTVYARVECIGGREPMVAYFETGGCEFVSHLLKTVQPEYYLDVDWIQFDATFDKGGVTFAKESDNGK
jgi:hypothetical protein